MFLIFCIKAKLINDTHMEKLCFVQESIKTEAWLLLTYFMHNQLSSIHSIVTY